jgi:dihydroxy-acid dehydratase
VITTDEGPQDQCDAMTVGSKTIGENCGPPGAGLRRDLPYKSPLKKRRVPQFEGNLFESAIMKLSVIRMRSASAISQPKDRNASEGRAIVFDGPEDYHHRIDDRS